MKNKVFTARVTVEIRPTAAELADAFWDLDANQQAEFFNRLAEITTSHNLYMQLSWMVDGELLTPEAKQVMRTIGEYGQ